MLNFGQTSTVMNWGLVLLHAKPVESSNQIPLPERIGLQHLPFREKLKENYSLLPSSSF